MLSNHSPTNPNARQSQHRRQNSTPSAFDSTASNVPRLNTGRPATAHSRGLSLDTRRQQTASRAAWQDEYQVRTTTNMTGLANIPQHHHLRGTQQQRTQARPGPPQPQYVLTASNNRDDLTIPPWMATQIQPYDASPSFPSMSVTMPFGATWNMMMQRNQESFATNMAGSEAYDPYSYEPAFQMQSYMNLANGLGATPDSAGQVWPTDDTASRSNPRRISNGIMERVNRFEKMSMEEAQQPVTPPSQNANHYLPLTPMETPHDRITKQAYRRGRFSHGYDESMEETVRPNQTKRPRPSTDSSFNMMRQQAAEQNAVPSPPQTSTIPTAKTFHSLQAPKSDLPSTNTPRCESANTTASMSRQELSATQHGGQPAAGAYAEAGSGTKRIPRGDSAGSSGKSTNSTPHHRRTESVASAASAASAASIADINIEETRTDTGVSLEEITQFIQSPETTDGKWTCLFEDCGKKFGRKENIKSHVQTHLNDRQYQCPTCHKCFVRQHDLKRHAKIHTGVKPYPCDCGNSFARHDALTRHRQRGMCIGAFDGATRKVAKRGRPRKKRPDMETRTAKSSKTRKKNMSVSSVSTVSTYSDYSAVESPINDLEMADEMIDIDMAEVSTTTTTATTTAATTATTTDSHHGMPSLSTAPMPAQPPRDVVRHPTPARAAPVANPHSYVSPEPMMDILPPHAASSARSSASHYNTPPPAPAAPVANPHSYVSPEPMMDILPPHAASSARSSASHYNTPPELSRSTSPPPARFFEMQATSNLSSAMNGTLSIGTDDQDDFLLQLSQDHELVQLDRDANMHMMNKFGDGFNETVGMFTNDDDMFFQ